MHSPWFSLWRLLRVGQPGCNLLGKSWRKSGGGLLVFCFQRSCFWYLEGTPLCSNIPMGPWTAKTGASAPSKDALGLPPEQPYFVPYCPILRLIFLLTGVEAAHPSLEFILPFSCCPCFKALQGFAPDQMCPFSPFALHPIIGFIYSVQPTLAFPIPLRNGTSLGCAWPT